MMKTVFLFLLLSCTMLHAQDLFETGEMKEVQKIIRSSDKPYPYLTVQSGFLEPTICIHILSGDNQLRPQNAFLQLSNGQTMVKTLSNIQSGLTEMVGYTEYKVTIPLNDSDLNFLSEFNLTQVHLNSIPVVLTDELQTGLLEEMKYIALKRNTIIDAGLTPTVVK